MRKRSRARCRPHRPRTTRRPQRVFGRQEPATPGSARDHQKVAPRWALEPPRKSHQWLSSRLAATLVRHPAAQAPRCAVRVLSVAVRVLLAAVRVQRNAARAEQNAAPARRNAAPARRNAALARGNAALARGYVAPARG